MNYVDAISNGFPGVFCHAAGDGSLYENIVWDGGLALPTKEALDAWIASNTVSTSTRITVLAFRNRFTSAEKVAIELASLDNPAATMEQRQLAASLRVFNADLAVASFVDVARSDTIAGVNMLEQYGIIAAGRAAQILSTAVAEAEKPIYY